MKVLIRYEGEVGEGCVYRSGRCRKCVDVVVLYTNTSNGYHGNRLSRPCLDTSRPTWTIQKRLSHSNVTDAVLGCSHCRHSVRDGLSGMSADSHLDYRHKASWPAHQTSSKLCRRQSGKDHYLCISHSRHQTAAHSVTRCHIL